MKDIAEVSQGPKIRLGQFARAIHRENARIVDNDDVVSGIVLLRKGAAADPALRALHEKIQEMNDHILPPGVKIVPFIDRSDLVHFTSHTVLHNLSEGMILGVGHSVPLPRERVRVEPLSLLRRFHSRCYSPRSGSI